MAKLGSVFGVTRGWPTLYFGRARMRLECTSIVVNIHQKNICAKKTFFLMSTSRRGLRVKCKLSWGQPKAPSASRCKRDASVWTRSPSHQCRLLSSGLQLWLQLPQQTLTPPKSLTLILRRTPHLEKLWLCSPTIINIVLSINFIFVEHCTFDFKDRSINCSVWLCLTRTMSWYLTRKPRRDVDMRKDIFFAQIFFWCIFSE